CKLHARGRVLLTDAFADFHQPAFLAKAAIDGYPRTGWAIHPQVGKDHTITFRTKQPLGIDPEGRILITLDKQYGDQNTIGRFKLYAITGDHAPLELADDVRKALRIPAEQRT